MANSAARFGLELAKALRARSMMEADLVRAMIKTGNGISRQYVNMMIHNERTPPPDMIEKLCDALALARDERTYMHRAAALDSGYRIGVLRG
jgi:hypothetical protein